jgi:hypothetical protein
MYRVFGGRGGSARFQEKVPEVKLHRYIQKHLDPKLDSNGDNGKKSCKE